MLFATDGWNSQRESNETNNIYAVEIDLVAPDLAITSAIAPTTAVVNSDIDVSWTVANTSDVDALADSWYDYIYLSDDDIYDDSDTYVAYAEIEPETPLKARESYTIEQEITLSNAQAGKQYLLFVTNLDDYQGETDKTNNVKAVEITLTAPDLYQFSVKLHRIGEVVQPPFDCGTSVQD